MMELGDRLERIEAVPADSPVAVSEEVSRAFSGRVQDLGEDARTSLLVAATDGASAATVYEACAVLGLTDPGLTEAEDAGLVTVLGDRIEFRHPLVRSAVYGAADPETRRAVHRALATVVPERETDRLAWHLSEGAVAPDEVTAGTLAEVAGRATARGAHAIATNALERAAELTGIPTLRTQRLAAAGSAAWLAGQTERALDLLDRALARTPDPRLRAHIQEIRGAVETRCGSLDDALATLHGRRAGGRGVGPRHGDPPLLRRHPCLLLPGRTGARDACLRRDRAAGGAPRSTRTRESWAPWPRAWRWCCRVRVPRASSGSARRRRPWWTRTTSRTAGTATPCGRKGRSGCARPAGSATRSTRRSCASESAPPSAPSPTC